MTSKMPGSTTQLRTPKGEPGKQVDVYLTNKLHGIVPGAMVYVKKLGYRDPRFPDRWAKQWVLEVPGVEPTVLGNYLTAAKEAVRLYRQKALADQYVVGAIPGVADE